LQSVFKIRHGKRESVLGLRRLNCRHLDEFEKILYKFLGCGSATILAENVKNIRQRVPGHYARSRMLFAPIQNRPTIVKMRLPIQGYIEQHVAIQ